MQQYTCKTIEAKVAKNNATFYKVSTTSGETFNLFSELGASMWPGIKFEATLMPKGKYLNVATGEDGELLFQVDQSTPRPAGAKPPEVEKPVTEKEKQDGMSRGNARTCIVNLLCSENAEFEEGERRATLLAIMPTLMADAGFEGVWVE